MKKIIIFTLLLLLTTLPSTAKGIKTHMDGMRQHGGARSAIPSVKWLTKSLHMLHYKIMKIYSILSVILVTLCFFACESNKENEYQPLTIENYAEVSLGDTTNLIITGGSGNIIVEGNDKVDISTAQNDKQKITLIGKEIGTTNIFVRDKITNESCSIEVNVILPFLTLNFEEEEGNHLNIRSKSLFVLVASEDSICYAFSYNNMQFKYNDIPIMKGTYHISQNGTMLSFDLKGENSTFEHSFKLKNDNVAYLLSNMSSINMLPQTYLTASFTDIETGIDFPHVFIGNKVHKTLPKRE